MLSGRSIATTLKSVSAEVLVFNVRNPVSQLLLVYRMELRLVWSQVSTSGIRRAITTFLFVFWLLVITNGGLIYVCFNKGFAGKSLLSSTTQTQAHAAQF